MANEFGDGYDSGSKPVEEDAAVEAPHTRARDRKRGWLGRRRQPPVNTGYPSTVSSELNDPWYIDEPSRRGWEDDDLQPSVPEAQEPDPISGDPKPHRRRRHQRKLTTRLTALAAAGTVAVTAALAAPRVFDSGGEHHQGARTSISAPRTPERHIDPELASLQKDYEDSHAEFQTGGQPFAIGLTPAEHARYQKLDAELKSGTLKIDDVRAYELLKWQQEQSSQEVGVAENLSEKYDGKFMGKVELSTGQKVNFYIINNKADRTVTIDAKALDAYFQWSIAHLADVYQPDGKGDDSARLAKIAQYQKLAKDGKLDTTMNIFFNPTPDQCFTKQDIIVPENISKTISTGNGTQGTETYTNPSCFDLGFNFSGEDTPVVIGLNAIDTIETRATEEDPNGPAKPISINGLLATLAVLVHEGVGHTAAQGDGLFPGGGEKDPPNGFSQDHLQLTNPLTNFAIRFLKDHTPGINEVPPLPITISG